MPRPRERGQLIPQEVTEERICMQLFIPNTREWRIAYMTALLIPTQGYHWLRDDEPDSIKRTQQIAWEVFRTFAPCEDSTGDFPDLPALPIILQELQKMKTCNCCTCAQNPIDSVGEEVLLPPELEEPPILPDADIPIDGGYLAYKCKAANWMVREAFRNTLLGITDFTEITDGVYEQVRGFIRGNLGGAIGGATFLVAWEIVQGIVYWLRNILTPIVTARLVAFMDNNAQDFVNDIFCADSPTDCIAAWHRRIRDTSELGFINKTILNFMILAIPFETFFQDIMERMGAEQYQHIIDDFEDDCSCPAPLIDINLPPEYVLVDMLPDVIGELTGAVVTSMGNELMTTGLNDSGWDMDAFNPILGETTVLLPDRVGYLFKLLFHEDNGNGEGVGYNVNNASIHIGTQSFGGSEGDWLVGEYAAGAIASEVNLQNWLTLEPLRRKDFDAHTDLGRVRSRFVQDQGGTPNGTSVFLVECFWIVRA